MKKEYPRIFPHCLIFWVFLFASQLAAAQDVRGKITKIEAPLVGQKIQAAVPNYKYNGFLPKNGKLLPQTTRTIPGQAVNTKVPGLRIQWALEGIGARSTGARVEVRMRVEKPDTTRSSYLILSRASPEMDTKMVAQQHLEFLIKPDLKVLAGEIKLYHGDILLDTHTWPDEKGLAARSIKPDWSSSVVAW